MRPGGRNHPRITYVAGAPESPDVAAEVAKLAPEPPDALVILGLGATPRVVAAFEQVRAAGPGRWLRGGGEHGCQREAGPTGVRVGTVRSRGGRPRGAASDFVPDPAGERYTVTFNRNGYLKRVRA